MVWIKLINLVLNQEKYILNYNNIKGKFNNQKEIKDSCEIYLNNKKIDFTFEYLFENENILLNLFLINY